MKKSLALVALALLIGVSAGAQNYAYVPDAAPGAGSNNLWPFNMSAVTVRYIQILDAKYLPGVPVKFTEVAFTRYASSGPITFDAKQFQLRMSRDSVPTSSQSDKHPRRTPRSENRSHDVEADCEARARSIPELCRIPNDF